MKVWIDQDLCTGDGLCTDHAPAVFTLLEDGIAYVKQGDRVLNDPGSAGSLASVPPRSSITSCRPPRIARASASSSSGSASVDTPPR